MGDIRANVAEDSINELVRIIQMGADLIILVRSLM